MLAVVIVMGAVALLLSRAFTGTMRVVRDAPAASNAIATSRSMLDALRRDVWSAGGAEPSADGQSMRVVAISGPVNWSVRSLQNDDGPAIEVTRSAGEDRRAWNLMATSMRFENSPAGAIVRFGPSPQGGDDSIALFSQLSQLNRAAVADRDQHRDRIRNEAGGGGGS